MKLRTDRQAAKPYTEDEQCFVGVLKCLNQEAGAAKFARSQQGKKSSAGGDDDGPKKAGSPVKQVRGVSKGGQLSKKEREVMGMAKGVVEGKEDGGD